jgi:hypothetical protein
MPNLALLIMCGVTPRRRQPRVKLELLWTERSGKLLRSVVAGTLARSSTSRTDASCRAPRSPRKFLPRGAPTRSCAWSSGSSYYASLIRTPTTRPVNSGARLTRCCASRGLRRTPSARRPERCGAVTQGARGGVTATPVDAAGHCSSRTGSESVRVHGGGRRAPALLPFFAQSDESIGERLSLNT